MDRQKNIKDFFAPKANQSTKRKRDEPTEDAPSSNVATSDEMQLAKKRRTDITSEEVAPSNVETIPLEKQNRLSNTRNTKLTLNQLDEICRIDSQYQPAKSFVFPKQVIGRSKNRSAQHSWFADFKWLHYDVKKDALLCFTCIRACNLIGDQKPDWLKEAELAFIHTGFTNWKDATMRLARHESSSFHQKSHHLIVQRESATPINAQLLNSVLKDQAAARTYLLRLISSIRYLCLSGNAIRGWQNNDGNLKELLREREMDVPEIKAWLSKRDNYTSPQIQNELIEIMAHEVQKVVLQRVKSSPWYALIVDGTTDVSSDEQLAMCARYTEQNSLDSREVFLGLYTTDDACAKTITSAIKDVLIRLDLSLEDLRGHCFDGAPVMAGRFNGVQKLLQDEQPKSLYIHCSNHSLDLVLQETAKQIGGVCDALNLVKDVSNAILDSAKRKKMYDQVVLEPCESDSDDDEPIERAPTRLAALCPTRWCARALALKRFRENYPRVQGTLIKLENCATVKADKKAQIRGWLLKLEQTETLFYLNVSIAIFAPCEQLARALQAPSLTATGAKQAAALLSSKLKNLRTEAEFNRIFENTLEESDQLELEPLKEPRVRQKNKRYEQTSKPTPPVKLSAKETLRKSYFEVLDLQISELEQRFEQSGFSVLEALETVLLNATKGLVSDELELTEELGIYSGDFKVGRLHAQLLLLESLTDIASSDIDELSGKMSKLPSTTKIMLDQVIRLIILVKTAPAAAATAERSFSALRRVKTYLRSTMSQKRLTHVMLLHVHKDITAGLDLNIVLKEFVARSERRKTVFGKVV